MLPRRAGLSASAGLSCFIPLCIIRSIVFTFLSVLFFLCDFYKKYIVFALSIYSAVGPKRFIAVRPSVCLSVTWLSCN